MTRHNKDNSHLVSTYYNIYLQKVMFPQVQAQKHNYMIFFHHKGQKHRNQHQLNHHTKIHQKLFKITYLAYNENYHQCHHHRCLGSPLSLIIHLNQFNTEIWNQSLCKVNNYRHPLSNQSQVFIIYLHLINQGHLKHHRMVEVVLIHGWNKGQMINLVRRNN